ncbi:MAG TPA: OsmC family protein [Candidatus Paceibacterota bacterium]|nr:OsmC family protein [Candidatus Paceibacterota bacterium]
MGTIINAIDVDQLRQMQERLKSDRSAGNKQPEIVAKWIGGGSAEIVMGDRKMVIGGPGNLNAVGALLGSLAACDIDVILMHAALKGLVIEDVRIEVSGKFNTAGFYGASDEGSGYEVIESKVFIKAPGATQEQVAYLKEQCEHHSPVGDSLARAVPLKLSFQLE